MKKENERKNHRWLNLMILAFGGGIIYQLPYLRLAFYIPLQDALEINHHEYGLLMTAYAVTAMISYFPGGWLADRFSPKKLILFSLFSTGLTGFWFSSFPSFRISLGLHVFWGFSTILTYWAPLMKLTRAQGESGEQGKMYGFLEGGRGAISLIGSFLLLALFARLGSSTLGLTWVVRAFAVSYLVTAVLTWFFVEDRVEEKNTSPSLSDMIKVVKMPRVWLLSFIIFTVYAIYAGQTFIVPYLKDCFGLSVNTATAIGMARTYGMMCLGGPVGGILADKIGSPIRTLGYGFFLMALSWLLILLLPVGEIMVIFTITAMMLLGFAVYALRGIYFSTLDEMGIPLQITGAVVGLVSLIGYLPDTFIYTLLGGWLDRAGNSSFGYRQSFLLLFALVLVGWLIQKVLLRTVQKK